MRVAPEHHLLPALLQSRDNSNIPPEENVESACEMITVTGKMLAGSENKKTRDTLDGYLARLTRLSGDKNLPSRLRFLVRGAAAAAAAGLQELSRQHGCFMSFTGCISTQPCTFTLFSMPFLRHRPINPVTLCYLAAPYAPAAAGP
jgi:hypothetical protein